MEIFTRRAEDYDIDWLIGQLRQFSDFFDSKHKLFPDPDSARVGLKSFIDNHYILIADTEAYGPAGFIAGMLFNHPFNPSIKVLNESFWWVDPEFRGTKAGSILLYEFIQFGKANVNWVWMTLETNSPIKDEVLTKRGFILKERNYLMEI